MTTNAKNYLGIDVCKTHLDIAHAQGVQRQLNTPAAIAAFLAKLPAHSHLIVEATGGYERALTQACHRQALAVSVVNPARVRHFAKACGQLAKTDPIDAGVLRAFGVAIAPPADPQPDPASAELTELVNARDQLVALRVQLSNSLEHASLPLVRQVVQSLRALCEQRIAKLEAALATCIEGCAALAARATALRSHHGIGPLTAACLLAHLPELGQANRQQIAALAGLAPYNRESGQSKSPRFIHGGRPKVRRALYLATLSVIRAASPLSAFYHRLRARGKPAKVALIATARKLLCLLNSSLKTLPS